MFRSLTLLALLSCFCLAPAGTAQDPADAEKPQDTPPSDENIANRQLKIANRFRRLEDLLFRMADFESTQNPRRATLLKQAYKESKDRLISKDLDALVELLGKKSLKPAVEGQKRVEDDLQALLQLLLSENRSDRLKDEQQKLQNAVKELKKLQQLQRSNRGRTEGNADLEDLSRAQQKIADRTSRVAEQLEETEGGEPSKDRKAPTDQDDKKPAPDNAPSKGDDPTQESTENSDNKKDSQTERSQSDSQPADTPPGDDAPGAENTNPSDNEPTKDSNSAESNSPERPPSPENKSDGQSGKPGDNSGESANPSESQSPQTPPTGDPQQDIPPSTQQRVQQAEQKMRQAQQQLENAQRKESVESQKEAEQKLEEAIAELEKILRQFREEEVDRMLALLESRFRKMRDMQLKVNDDTLRLDRFDESKRDEEFNVRCSRLSVSQQKIVLEASRTLTLLLEEGSSIAFPETVQQMRDDMEQVARRLAESQVGDVTQVIEQDILQTLEELIESLQQAQSDREQQQQQQQQQQRQQQQSEEPPLVTMLEELRMIRALQLRVNRRTKSYSRILVNPDDPVGQAKDPDLQNSLRELSQREARIQRITRDLVLGKNR